MKKLVFSLLLGLCSILAVAQPKSATQILSFEDYLSYVDAFHPVARQAFILKENARAELTQARGGFDPEIFHNSGRKNYTDKDYFFHSTTGLKLPLWYGIELKAQYDLANGQFLNPENTVPNQGLNTVGIKIPLLQGLLVNERMAALKQAKILQELADAEMQKELNKLYQKATIAYWDWSGAVQKLLLYQSSYDLAQVQLQNTKQLYEQGAKSAFDTLKTYTQMQKRLSLVMEYQQKEFEKRAKAANYLWTSEQKPVLIPDGIIPESIVGFNYSSNALDSVATLLENLQNENPELKALQFKLDQTVVKQNLQTSKLLPKLDFNYNFLNEGFALPGESFTPAYFENNYKWGINFSYPIFIRSERGKFTQSKLQVENFTLERDQRTLEIQNEISALILNFQLINQQIELGNDLVVNFQRLFEGERTMFFNGESDFFVVNQRELEYLEEQNKLIDLNVKQIEIGTSIDLNLGAKPGK